MSNSQEKTGLAWHPAFCSAAEFDLRDDAENLYFEREHNLSKEPLRMDLLIVKKKGNVTLSNEIGRNFRKWNIIEYKNPDDELSIDDFFKVLGYACIYKSQGKKVNEIPASEITVAFFRDAFPINLFKQIEAMHGVIEESARGIYTISGIGIFPVQIIVTRRLDTEKHPALKILSKRTTKDEIRAFLKEAAVARSQNDKNNIDSILEVSVAVNMNLFDEVRRDDDMCDALRTLMKDEIQQEIWGAEKRGEEKGMEKGMEKGIQKQNYKIAFRMYQKNIPVSEIADTLDVPAAVVEDWLGLVTL